ncbi:hypothetical protein PQX77_012936 [Marasmius sp. AFHP31]|nr:hypothetical protein PQX77_012936 [Marasmius sp. AFHP31]
MPSLKSGKTAADARKALVKDVRTKVGDAEVLFKGSFELSVKTGKGGKSLEDSEDEGKDGNEGDTGDEEDRSKGEEDPPEGFQLVEGFKDLWVRRVRPSEDASRPARRTPSPEKGALPVLSSPSPSHPAQPSTVSHPTITPARLVFPAARRTPSPEKKLAAGPSSPTRSNGGSPSRSPTRKANANPSDNGGLGRPSSTGSPSKGKKAYVLYKGSRPSVSTIKRELEKQKDGLNVFKGFDSFEEANKAFRAAKNSRVVEELKATPPEDGQLVWVVVEGIAPGIHESAYEMLRDGLGWHGGVVHSFVDKEEAEAYWDDVLEDDLCVTFDGPTCFDSSGVRIS